MPSRISFIVSILLIGGIFIFFAGPESKVSAAVDLPSFLYTSAKSYDALAWMYGAERFPSGATLMLRDGQGTRQLAPGFAASADSVASFDGERVLFAGKSKAQDPWQIWEMPMAGGEPRRITSCTDDCIRPFYLPENRVVYAHKIGGRFVVEVRSLSGDKPLALTYGPASYLPTDILRDGRILFEASYPLGTGKTPELYTVYSDGSGVESYRCDHRNARSEGKQTNSGDIVFASSATLARFTSAQGHEVSIAAPAGEYAGEVAETTSGDWLFPWRATAITPFQLMFWTPGTGKLRPAVVLRDANALQPTVISKREVPKRHPSGLHEGPNANLLCLNAYVSKFKFSADSIHAVRLYTRDSAGNPQLLGTAQVERDGSFFVHVPTEQALQIELLDDAGHTLQRESGFFWMRRGEQRACVGCHAGPETAPENAVPQVLLKSTTPTDMTGGDMQNASGGH